MSDTPQGMSESQAINRLTEAFAGARSTASNPPLQPNQTGGRAAPRAEQEGRRPVQPRGKLASLPDDDDQPRDFHDPDDNYVPDGRRRDTGADEAADSRLDDALDRSRNALDDPGDDQSDDPGDDPGDDQGDDQHVNADGDVEFEHNGRRYVVPKEVVQGNMRDADYRQKTELLAGEKRFIAAERARLQLEAQAIQVLAPAVQQLQNLAERINYLEDNMPSGVVDPAGKENAERQLRKMIRARDDLARAIDVERNNFQTQQSTRNRELLETSLNAVRQAIPEWSPKIAREVIGFAINDLGYTPEEIESQIDPRFIRMAYMAYRATSVQQKSRKTLDTVRKAPPIVRPRGVVDQRSTNETRKRNAMVAARKSGTTTDAEAAMLHVLRSSVRRSR